MGSLLSVLLALAPVQDPAPAVGVGPVPEQLRLERDLDPFYGKHCAVEGFPILGSMRVSDAALREAAWIVRRVLADRDDVLHALAENGVHLVVMAHDEYTTDVPEHSRLEPAVYWDRRARGLGGSPVSCAEENLLTYPGDPYSTENILIHEFAHIIHSQGVGAIDGTFDTRLKEAYEAATAAGRWEGTYAASNRGEYWAEAVQSWFGDNRENDSLHNHVDTRKELREYDPAVAALCEEVFGDKEWRYVRPLDRKPEDRAHLADVDWQNLPTFKWREVPMTAKPIVQIETQLGRVVIELEAEAAPATVANFLHYVHNGLYGDGAFFRTVRADNQPDQEYPIAGVQGRADLSREDEFPAPIRLERTRDTGLSHRDGTITLAREGPDTGRDHFFICIGDQPELDFGGRRNPDGQGFAAFGRVIEGMSVVRRLQASPAEGQDLEPAIGIQRAIRWR